MLRGVIICPDTELSGRLEALANQVSHFAIIRTLDQYPEPVQLVRFLRAHAPDVIFISAASMGNVEEIANCVEQHVPGLPLIAIHRHSDPNLLMDVMRLGIREFLPHPFDFSTLMDSLVRVREKKERTGYGVQASDHFYTFLPAKPGVGTSTIACNASFAMAELCDQKGLLSDFDLNSGMIRFMLKLQTGHCVTDAAENATRMDENLWPQLVTTVGNLDVIHAGKLNPNFRIEALHLRHLLSYWRRNYGFVCADLSGNLEKYSLELMHESKRIFLVATPEIPSLYLACEKYKYLQQVDLGDRVTLLLNRVHKKMFMSEEEIQQIVGLPVTMSFQNDYNGVLKALTAARQVSSETVLGKQFGTFAQTLLQKTQTGGTGTKRRFLEYFTLSASKNA